MCGCIGVRECMRTADYYLALTPTPTPAPTPTPTPTPARTPAPTFTRTTKPTPTHFFGLWVDNLLQLIGAACAHVLVELTLLRKDLTARVAVAHDLLRVEFHRGLRVSLEHAQVFRYGLRLGVGSGIGVGVGVCVGVWA